MALIKCPECEKEISDKAAACIHCGCPTNIATNIPAITGYYIVSTTGSEIMLKCPKCSSLHYIPKKDVSITSEAGRDRCLLNSDCVCACGYSAHVAADRVRVHTTSAPNLKAENVVKCPKCKSTQIQVVPRKWSMMTGLLTNKVDRVCLNCKNKF